MSSRGLCSAVLGILGWSAFAVNVVLGQDVPTKALDPKAFPAKVAACLAVHRPTEELKAIKICMLRSSVWLASRPSTDLVPIRSICRRQSGGTEDPLDGTWLA